MMHDKIVPLLERHENHQNKNGFIIEPVVNAQNRNEKNKQKIFLMNSDNVTRDKLNRLDGGILCLHFYDTMNG
jgi:hypothetical protein